MPDIIDNKFTFRNNVLIKSCDLILQSEPSETQTRRSHKETVAPYCNDSNLRLVQAEWIIKFAFVSLFVLFRNGRGRCIIVINDKNSFFKKGKHCLSFKIYINLCFSVYHIPKWNSIWFNAFTTFWLTIKWIYFYYYTFVLAVHDMTKDTFINMLVHIYFVRELMW